MRDVHPQSRTSEIEIVFYHEKSIINGVVESKEARYFQPWEIPGIYYTVERP